MEGLLAYAKDTLMADESFDIPLPEGEWILGSNEST